MSEKYILLADSNQDVLNIQEAALKYFYGGDIFFAKSKDEVLTILKREGRPELIFIDYGFLTQDSAELHRYLEENNLRIPVIACAENPEAKNQADQYLMISAILDRPINVDSFISLVKGITSAPMISPGFVPVKINTVLEHGIGDFDFFLKLSGTNYIKILNKGDRFSKGHAEKLQSKGIQEIHIRSSDSHDFLKIWEDCLKQVLSKKNVSPEEGISVAMETLEQLENISKALGWSQEVVIAAQALTKEAIKILVKDSQLSDALKRRLTHPSSNYSMHISMMSYLSCCLMSHIDPGNVAAQMKLAMACLLHDLAVDESYYDDIDEWNKRASNLKDKTPESYKYRLHPLEASQLAQSLNVLPPDVDQIILQHHETKDGTGFPRALSSTRISLLSTIFIMVEDLIEFILRGEHLETSIKDYLVWGEYYYDQGHFKKVFEAIKEKLP